MQNQRTGPLPTLSARRYSTWLLAGSLALVCAVSLQRSFSLVEHQMIEAQNRTHDELARSTETQTRAIQADLIRSLRALVRSDGASVELNANPLLLDAYLWRRSAGPEQPFLWPVPSPTVAEHEIIAQTECLRLGQDRVYVGDHVAGAEAFDQCPDMPIDVRTLAGVLAAREWLKLGRPELALLSLHPPDLPYDAPLLNAPSRGVSIRRAIDQREEAIAALHALRRDEEASTLAQSLLTEILALPAPLFHEVEGPADRLLRALPQPDPGLERRRALAAARVSVWSRLSQGRTAIIAAAAETAKAGLLQDAEPALHVDGSPTTDVPALVLRWVRLDDDLVAVAVIDGESLLTEMVDQVRRAAPADARIDALGPNGQPLRAELPVTEEESNTVTVSLAPFLPHLRIARVQDTAATDAFTRELLFSQTLPILLALLLGGLAIVVHTEADRRLKDLYDRQQAFITRVTHELKTPLSGIRIMAESIAMGAAGDPATTRIFIDRILKETEKLGARIDEVLTAARRPEIKSLVAVLPHELAGAVCEIWRPRFEAAGAALEVDLRPCEPLSIDPALVRDALSNLLDNALKYSRVGIPAKVRVRTQDVGRWCIFEVTDNGLGVPSNMRRRIFERFTRVEGPGRGKTGGHGLGLSFVSETAEAHGGMVECLDGLDGGARFRLKLKRHG